MVEEKRKTPNKPLFEKKEEARHVCKQRDKGWIHVIRVHDATHCSPLSSDNNTAGQQRLAGYPTQRKTERDR